MLPISHYSSLSGLDVVDLKHHDSHDNGALIQHVAKSDLELFRVVS